MHLVLVQLQQMQCNSSILILSSNYFLQSHSFNENRGQKFKKFSEEFVLKDISLTIEKNKSTIILGQSGCGKSVLIKTIYKLFNFDSGSILYDGKLEVDIDKFSMLFQYGALFDGKYLRILHLLILLTIKQILKKVISL